MKKIIPFIVVIVMLFSSVSICYAKDNASVVDNAGLLTKDEVIDLETMIDELIIKHNVDITILTTLSTNGKDIVNYSDDYFIENGYGIGANRDGVILVINMEARDWYISTSGFGITSFTDYGIEKIGEEIVTDLGSESYHKAFVSFLYKADEYIEMARDGNPYDVNNKSNQSIVFSIILIMSFGLIVGLIVVQVMKSQLKMAVCSNNAHDFINKDTIQINDQKDIFISRAITRIPIVKASNNGGSSTHKSSSGSTHGGGGGKF